MAPNWPPTSGTRRLKELPSERPRTRCHTSQPTGGHLGVKGSQVQILSARPCQPDRALDVIDALFEPIERVMTEHGGRYESQRDLGDWLRAER
jgi:hypothetical protein